MWGIKTNISPFPPLEHHRPSPTLEDSHPSLLEQCHPSLLIPQIPHTSPPSTTLLDNCHPGILKGKSAFSEVSRRLTEGGRINIGWNGKRVVLKLDIMEGIIAMMGTPRRAARRTRRCLRRGIIQKAWLWHIRHAPRWIWEARHYSKGVTYAHKAGNLGELSNKLGIHSLGPNKPLVIY